MQRLEKVRVRELGFQLSLVRKVDVGLDVSGGGILLSEQYSFRGNGDCGCRGCVSSRCICELLRNEACRRDASLEWPGQSEEYLLDAAGGNHVPATASYTVDLLMLFFARMEPSCLTSGLRNALCESALDVMVVGKE